jgi:hypothetical protein
MMNRSKTGGVMLELYQCSIPEYWDNHVLESFERINKVDLMQAHGVFVP